MGYLILITIIIIAGAFIFVNKTGDEYESGYKAAIETIEKGYSSQAMYEQCLREGNGDSWDKGWMNACVDKGAKR